MGLVQLQRSIQSFLGILAFLAFATFVLELPSVELTPLGRSFPSRVVRGVGDPLLQATTSALHLHLDVGKTRFDGLVFAVALVFAIRGIEGGSDAVRRWRMRREDARRRQQEAAARRPRADPAPRASSAPAAAPSAPASPRPPAPTPTDGKRRIGRYELVVELGRGGMGVVYQAFDPQIGRAVAIKVITTTGLAAGEIGPYRDRFFNEARAAGRMKHPGIVTIYDIGEDAGGGLYLVMEYVDGPSAAEIWAGKERPSVERALSIVLAVADALDYAHRHGVIHRDLKPANILIGKDGVPKLADFGIAKLADVNLTKTSQLVGTPAFMSPEQLSGAAVDARSDLFALGAVFYWLCTGLNPFIGDNVSTIIYMVLNEDPEPARDLNPELPAALDAVFAKALAKARGDRYQNAAEFAEAVRTIGRQLGGAGRGASGAPEAGRTGESDPTLVPGSKPRG